MRKCFVFLMVLCFKAAFSQLNDSFTDGNFTASPEWKGDISAFTINTGKQLQTISNSEPQTFSLSTANSISINAKWEFYVQLGFDPSANNQARIYLSSDNENLKNALNGYFIQLGETGSSDSYDLYRQNGTTITRIIDGLPKTRVSTNQLIARIQITRTGSGVWELKTDITGGINFVSEGTATDNTFTSGAFFGIHCKYTTTNSDKFIFDDFRIETLISDITSPKLLSASVIDSLTIEVLFDEPVDNTSAVALTNFSLNNSHGNPAFVSATSDEAKYRLKFSKAFNTGKYVLTANNIKDKNNNVISGNNTATFNYVKPYVAAKNDLVINELFADPSPQIDLPSVEFVELFNTTGRTIHLKNWKYGDATTIINFPADSIGAGEFLLITAKADTAEFKRFGKVLGISPWPSLNNAGDVLKLISPDNKTIDSVSYADTWYRDAGKKQGGWTLERIDFYSLCQGLFNWNSSIDISGGTPGKQNSIYQADYDRLALKADSIKQLSDSTIRVFFNKHLDASTLQGSKFNLSPVSANLSGLSMDNECKQATLTYAAKFSPATLYTLNISAISDCGGNRITGTNQPLTFRTASLPVDPPERQYNVLITEIFPDPSPQIGLPEVEFVELYNPSDVVIDLEGMIYEDGSATKYTFKKAALFPKEYLIICPEKDTLMYKPFGRVLGISIWPSLNNDKDVLILKNNKGNEFHRVSYNSGWYKDNERQQGGWSLELIDPQAICSGSQNWTASINTEGGSPGKQNSVYKMHSTNDPLKLISAILIDSITVQLNFNRSVDSTSASVKQNFKFNNGVPDLLSAMAVGPDFETVLLKFSSVLTHGYTYKVTGEDVMDCGGIVISASANSAEFIYPDRIAKNDLIINEVLFNPRAGGVDFIEIYNKSDKLLDMKDLFLATVNAKDSVVGLKQLSAFQLLIKPHRYVVLTTDPDNIKKEYFIQDPDSFYKMGSMPAFNDDEGAVVLMSNNSRIDQLNYSEKMHFPLIKNPEGVSLERSSFNRPTNESGNFRSSSASAGYATPGYKNSQYSENTAPGDQEVVLTSRTFSPDNDGFEDLLLVNYNFPKQGMIANASVYDNRGILIRKIAKNLILGVEGVISWDGLTEYNELSPVGIYMIYLEVFNLDGTVKKYRKNCVLASKLN